jgi:hypothetical protein
MNVEIMVELRLLKSDFQLNYDYLGPYFDLWVENQHILRVYQTPP